jgi:hypothetical protein
MGSSPRAHLPIQAVAAPGGLLRAVEKWQGGWMNDRDRLDLLRELLDRLERMPASASRDRTLADVRARVVDVETGTPPTPMRALPQDELEAEIAAERSPRAEPVTRVKTRPRRPSRRVQRARLVHPAARMPPAPVRERGREEVVDLLEQGGTMCLDEPAAAAAAAHRPWSAGLRG